MEIYRDLNSAHELAADIGAIRLDGYSRPVTWPLMPRVSPQGRVAWKAHADGALWTLDRGQTAVPVKRTLPARALVPPGGTERATTGKWPCAWGPEETLYVQIDASGKFLTIAPDGTEGDYDFSAGPNGGYSPEGIHHIDPVTRAPVLIGLTPSVDHDVIHGIECWQIDRDPLSPWIVALSNGGGPAGCVVKINPITGDALMWVVASDIQHPPRIVNRRVVWSGPDSPEPDDLSGWQLWTGPYQPPIVVPPTTPVPPVVVVPQPPPPPTPIDCELSAWSEWSSWAPLKSFGRQRRQRARSVVIEARNGGKPCEGVLSEAEDRTDPQLPGWLRGLVDRWHAHDGPVRFE